MNIKMKNDIIKEGLDDMTRYYVACDEIIKSVNEIISKHTHRLDINTKADLIDLTRKLNKG